MMNDKIWYRLAVQEGRKDLAEEYKTLNSGRGNTEEKIALRMFFKRNDIYLLGLV